MLRNISKLEIQVGERLYQFFCDQDSPINEAKEAIFQILKFIGQVEDAHRQKQSESEPKQEEKTDDQAISNN